MRIAAPLLAVIGLLMPAAAPAQDPLPLLSDVEVVALRGPGRRGRTWFSLRGRARAGGAVGLPGRGAAGVRRTGQLAPAPRGSQAPPPHTMGGGGPPALTIPKNKWRKSACLQHHPRR